MSKTLSDRSAKKCARMLALANAAADGYLDPATVNISDLARMFGVNRSTILKDFRASTEILALSEQYKSMITNNPPGTSEQWRDKTA